MKKRNLILLFGLGTIASISVYVLFRLSTVIRSLSFVDDFLQLVLIFTFFLAELFILLHATGYFVNILRSSANYQRKYIGYASIRSHEPTVSILIPTHDEPVEILKRTIIASKYTDYEKKEIIILDACDDKKNSQATQKLTKEMGVKYFFVPHPRHGAKAGSINELLPAITSPYIVIFDADYRASRNFLKLLVAQMEEDKKLAYIQTPQFYGNLRESEVSRAAQLQQSIFYEYICEGKSLTGGMFMCGTNLILRTKAIKAVDGFIENSITEDFATSFELHRQGWKSSYYNFTTAFGDGPLNLEQYLRQQYRWARGSIGVFLTMLPYLFFSSRHISFSAKIEYVLAGSYYFVGLVWLTFILLPITYVFFRIPAHMSDPWLYVASYLPYFLTTVIFFMVSLIKRHYKLVDWLKSQSLAFMAVPTYVRAAIDAIFHRRAQFKKTKKDAEIDAISWSFLFGVMGLIGLSFIAMIAGIGEGILYGFNSVVILNVWWSFFHTFILSFIIFILYAKKKRRS